MYSSFNRPVGGGVCNNFGKFNAGTDCLTSCRYKHTAAFAAVSQKHSLNNIST